MKKISWIFLAAFVMLVSPLLASHSESDELYRIERLSRELKEVTEHVHKSARYYADSHDYGERDALRALYRLREAADQYQCSVEESYGDFYETERSYRKLHYAFVDAREAFHDLYRYEHLTYDFRRVGSLVDQLERYYDDGYGRRGRAGDKPYGHRQRPKVRLRIDWPW